MEIQATWRDRAEAAERLLAEVRAIWAEGYMPPIPGEGAVLRPKAVDRLNKLLTDETKLTDG